ncbi:tail fiber protein [Pedobacter nutrimenti]|uniref:tail fiber protein n=1 Tax=Pedobacter nutrimenti TaxID=1241337 RepID=UPI00292F7D0C|nr:tail fiber protein [Pedobacter nutrimenti]
MKKILFYLLFFFTGIATYAQNTPVFNGKQLINVTTVSAWDVAQRPPGWYRIATLAGASSRANATFELRDNSQHSTLRFEAGISFNQAIGSSLTVTSHSYYNVPAFLKVRFVTSTVYSDSYLEVYVKPLNNNNNPFYAYVINPLSYSDWQLVNWTPGEIPSGYTAVEFDVDKLFSVGNMPNNNILAVNRNGYVGIGTDTPKEKLSVNGKIRAQELKIETANWPDYVFEKDYELPTLEETETQIKLNGHLPGIPSAAEVKAEGIEVGGMNAKLLKKIEELTLYLIELKKENSQLSKRVTQIEQKK